MIFPLNDDTRWILGQPNFRCGAIAQFLRILGHSIEYKAEEEQAAVIYWMLTLYDKHGSDWRVEANRILQKMA